MVISDQNEAKQAPVKKELNEGLAHFFTIGFVIKNEDANGSGAARLLILI